MDETVGSDFGLWFEDPSPLLPVYLLMEGVEELVEEASGSLDSMWDHNFTVYVLVYELTSCGKEERNAC